jgi:hypothetical protein
LIQKLDGCAPTAPASTSILPPLSFKR